MTKLLLPLLLLITASTLPAQLTPLSSNLFLQQDKGENETHLCIQIRRGDIITLTGKIEFISGENNLDQKDLYFTSLGGRAFLLRGEMLSEITALYQTISGNITLTGKVLFEGLEEMPAEMEVLSYNP